MVPGFAACRPYALSLEVRALNRLRGYSRILEELLPIIASPVFSEIVVVEDVR